MGWNKSKQFEVSGALYSQVFSKDILRRVLGELEWHEWEQKYNHHDFEIELWQNGIRVKQVGKLISYKILADYLKECDDFLAAILVDRLEIQRHSENIWLVKGGQKNQYAVFRDRTGSLSCECMKFKMRKNRLGRECPPLFKALDRNIFCHHTLAVGMWMEEYEDIFGKRP